MKALLSAILLLFCTSAFAADYSGCYPNTGEFSINRRGVLTVKGAKRSSGGVFRKKSEAGTESYRLETKGNRPVSVVRTIPLFGDHNPQTETLEWKFGYENDKCFLASAVRTYSHGDDAGKKLVAYEREFCDELSDWMKGPDSGGRRKGAKKILDAHNSKAAANGAELFGYRPSMGTDESYDVAKHALKVCKGIRQQFSFAYTKGARLKRAFGINATGITEPGAPKKTNDAR